MCQILGEKSVFKFLFYFLSVLDSKVTWQKIYDVNSVYVRILKLQKLLFGWDSFVFTCYQLTNCTCDIITDTRPVNISTIETTRVLKFSYN